ncbi:hypothetical protein OIB37_05310 [Streptomyces sp. NBC_00820]|uniref:hypothetical protein n=1 Tax=Streptomyces sp. NBC_00820 TaxID=2975842 RepID=UPI002ED438BB|nr:hypothetical protein OIB37_05310 [Streptomyces sp. NBC_00820]
MAASLPGLALDLRGEVACLDIQISRLGAPNFGQPGRSIPARQRLERLGRADEALEAAGIALLDAPGVVTAT